MEVTALDEEFRSKESVTVTSYDDEVVVRHLAPGVNYMVRVTSVNMEGRRSQPTPKLYESTRLLFEIFIK